MKYWFWSLIFCLVGNSLFSQQIRIGVYRDHDIKRITFSNNGFSYSVFGDTTDFGAILQNEFVDLIQTADKKIELFIGVKSQGKFNKINLIEIQANSSITLTPTSPQIKERKYKNDFEITVGEKGLTIVNVVDMNNYLSGVVESSGPVGK